ncbi:hypothetical protein [Campylobacter jejuni]|uniref:hypothetical protein n=1 Tax=Campylobacter jejuni TaxID=197 RepID=UPI000F8109E7|nr:hypothetical protein [Campylobacter jejuni]RTJ56084.1 hypothetical protein C3H64_05545 [Campylobacter jejuni]RTK00152.1 hypothetical protein C3H36_03225 [Campylobacter jejuni]
MLISKTTLSYLNDTNLKEHILYAIQNEVVLAVINRDFTEDENGNRIDDITPEEIQVGTQAVKEYCLANNELELLKQYIPLVLSGAELLTEMKTIKLIEINKAYENAILTVQKDYIPASEMLSFEAQERESIAYKNSNYQDTSLCPFMQTIATARGIDLRTLCDKAIEKATLYRQASGALIGKRQGLQDRVELVQSLDELNLIVWDN